MKVVDRAYVESNKEEILRAIKDGQIFIYPTDTIYGLGCNALIDDSVQKIRDIKKRDLKPFSIIAPSTEWILENCEVTKEDLDKYLPGPYTLFVRTKNECVSKEVNPNDDSLGVRIPDHWFTNLIQEVGVPFVTTSVNITGEESMKSIENLSEEIKNQVDYCIYEGEKNGPSSQKINLV